MIKKLLTGMLLALAIAILAVTSSAWAGDAAKGSQLFRANCASCHAGGKNLVNSAKTLQKADLEKYGMNSLEAITTQITKGKNAMPAFGGRLSEQQIDDLATYVLAQAKKDGS